MNFSLLIMIVMLAIVLPALARRFFSHDNEKPPERFLEPTVENVSEKNSVTLSDVSDTSMLFSPITQSPSQKELISQNIKITSQPGKLFMGYELWQALEDAGLKYGEKGLFHYVNDTEIVFSVAPTASPYTFYVDEIGSLATEGLIFILKKDSAYSVMQKMAEKLSDALEGEIHEGG